MDQQTTTTLVVYDHEDVIASGIVEVLADWHASGWVSDVAIVSVAEIERHGGDVGNVVVTQPPTIDTGPRRIRVKDLLDNPNIRLVALDPVGSTSEWTIRRMRLKRAADRAASALRHRHGAIGIIVAWFGGWWDAEALDVWPGWDTLIAAPEEAVSIEIDGTPLYCDLANPSMVAEVAGHAAAFTASTVGMWSGIAKSPFDHTDNQDDIRLGRCAHRRVDASAMADRLRQVALDPRNLREPGTLHGTSKAEFDVRVSDLDGLIARAQRDQPRAQPQRTETNWLDALKAFFSFMFAALRQAPKQAVAAAIYQGKAAVAAKVQQATYGQNSTFIVSVGGVTAEDRDISLGSLSEAVESLAEAVGNQGVGQAAHPGTGVTQQRFWRRVFNDTFALASGGDQDDAPHYQYEGKARHFKASELAPPVGPQWRPTRGTIPGLPPEGIEQYDMLAIGAAQRLLRQAGQSGTPGRREDAEHEAKSLADATAPWADAFIGRVGRLLAREVNRYAEEVNRLLKIARDAGQIGQRQAEVVAAKQKNRRTLARITGLVVGLMGLSVLLHFTIVPALALAVALPILLVGWLISVVVASYVSYKRMFQLEHQLERDIADVDDLANSLPVAVENARRMVRLYSQYLVWAPALSVFLNEPYGRPQHRPHELLGMVGAVPRSVSCGSYEVTDEGEANTRALLAVEGLRYSLSQLWRDFAESAHHLVLREEPQWRIIKTEDIWSEAEVGEDSYLAQWLARASTRSDGVLRASDALAGDVDQKQMTRILDGLEQSGSDALDGLRSAHRVRQVGDGGTPTAHRISASDRAAKFNTYAFSFDGIQAHMPVPDPAASRVMSSTTIRARATRNWLDEVDTAVSLSPQLTFGYLELRRGDDPGSADELIGGDTPGDPNSGELEDLGDL